VLDQEFDGADDVIAEVPNFDVDPQEIVQLEKDQRDQNDKLRSWFRNFSHLRELRQFNCLGPIWTEYQIYPHSVTLSHVLEAIIKNCLAKLVVKPSQHLSIGDRRPILHAFETMKVYLTRFLVLYRVKHLIPYPQTVLPTELIHQFIGPGLINRSHTCYINAFVQMLFHILPIRYLILALPDYDPVASKIRSIFVCMSRHQLTTTVSLTLTSQDNGNPTYECGEFAIRCLDAIRNACSDELRYTIENLLCFKLKNQI
jgi:hypothetical protein